MCNLDADGGTRGEPEGDPAMTFSLNPSPRSILKGPYMFKGTQFQSGCNKTFK